MDKLVLLPTWAYFRFLETCEMESMVYID